MASPRSATDISLRPSLADERRTENSVDKNGGRKLRPFAVYTGFFRFGRRYT